MQQAHVVLYRVKPGTVDEIIRRTKLGLVPIYRNQTGFVAYGLIKTEDDLLIALSVWHLPEQAEVADQTAAAWAQQHVGEMVESLEVHIGKVAFFWEPCAIDR